MCYAYHVTKHHILQLIKEPLIKFVRLSSSDCRSCESLRGNTLAQVLNGKQNVFSCAIRIMIQRVVRHFNYTYKNEQIRYIYIWCVNLSAMPCHAMGMAKVVDYTVVWRFDVESDSRHVLYHSLTHSRFQFCYSFLIKKPTTLMLMGRKRGKNNINILIPENASFFLSLLFFSFREKLWPRGF